MRGAHQDLKDRQDDHEQADAGGRQQVAGRGRSGAGRCTASAPRNASRLVSSLKYRCSTAVSSGLSLSQNIRIRFGRLLAAVAKGRAGLAGHSWGLILLVPIVIWSSKFPVLPAEAAPQLYYVL